MAARHTRLMSTEWADRVDTEDWDEDPRLPWLACPDANPQEVRRALGFRERNVGELELRIPLGGDDRGACQVIVEERDDEVHVRVLVCGYDLDDRLGKLPREYVDCPVRVWLAQPLGERAVIDMDSDQELPLFTPEYLDNVPQRDHGYRPANRRRRMARRP
jgi:hypothetical protein